MPIYDYYCEACGQEFEELILGRGDEVSCPECEGTQVRRLMSRVSFRTTGGGGASSGGGCASCAANSCAGCSSGR